MSMKKKIVPFFLLFLVATPAYANSASVNINNSVNTSGTNTNTTKSETHIKVETNGKVTEYNSNEPGSVEVKSINGESTIKVNGQTVSGTPTEEDVPTATASPTAKPTSTPDDNEKEELSVIKKVLEEINETLEKILDVLR